ncbi:MAG: polyphosphate kinase 1 [Pyrinomonadaceae bacterium]|nr:polyphosphate kinase 1 [Pyrinomonadaceae bacterium]
MTTPLNHYLLKDEREVAENSPPAPSFELPPDAKHLLAWCVFNRDLSQLEFFRRVLEEALDDSLPLLERLKFLSVFSSNLDEFFMVRVSGLKEVEGCKDIGLTPGELMPAEQLSILRERLLPMFDEAARCLRDEVLPGLEARGVRIAAYSSLSVAEKRRLADYFSKNIFPILTPLAVNSAQPFPYIPGLCLNIVLTVEPIPEHGITRSLIGSPEARFVHIRIPPQLPRLIPVGDKGGKFTLIEEVIEAHLHTLFPRMRVSESHVFRVTRDADVEIREDQAADLLRLVKESLRERRFGMPVRLEVPPTMPREMIEYLTDSLNLTANDVYAMGEVLDAADLMSLYDLDRGDLKDEPLEAIVPASLGKKKSFFDLLKKRDILLHHPYTSYTTVTDFIYAAAKDRDVVAIKMCLYRTGQDSPIPQALIEASEAGKQVTAVVEIKARFDEERNIEWAERLAESGVHVVHGVAGYKTHCKVALVVRRESHGLQTYVHIATGNYNPTTSKVYTDFGLLTADSQIGDDATDLFNFLTGFSRQKEYSRLLVAPVNLRARMLQLVERETAHARAGRRARIVAKTNRLTDLEIIAALYGASQAGVEIDLIVRGSCMLRPGVPGLSETINVRSVVGRFLEHSRIFYFANGGDEEVYIGSADWMRRNFDRRVEVVTPVLDSHLKSYLKDVVLAAYMRDNVKARVLNSEGAYERVPRAPGEENFDSQLHFAGDTSL